MLDVDSTGLIDKDELTRAIAKSNVEMNEEEIGKIMAEVNIKGNGEISYSEFLAATLELKEMLTNEKLYALFKEFDH